MNEELEFTRKFNTSNESKNFKLKCLHGFNKVSVIDKTGVVREDNKISLFELALLPDTELKKLRIRGLNENNKEFLEAKILKVLQNNLTHFFVVKFSNGAELLCTKDHKLFTNTGWKTLQELVSLESSVYIDEHAIDKIDKDKVKITKIDLNKSFYCYSERRFSFGEYDKFDFIHECKRKRITLKQMAEMLGVSFKLIEGWNKSYNDYIKTINKKELDNSNLKILALIENYINPAKYLKLEGQCYPVRIVDVEYFIRSYSYDLEIEMIGLNNKAYHNFFCNTVLVHNSG